MATPTPLIALVRVQQECRGVRYSGIAWLVVSALAGVLYSALGAYVVTALAALGATYALGLLVAASAIEREVTR